MGHHILLLLGYAIEGGTQQAGYGTTFTCHQVDTSAADQAISTTTAGIAKTQTQIVAIALRITRDGHQYVEVNNKTHIYCGSLWQ